MQTKELKIKGKDYVLAATLVLPDKTAGKLPAVVFYHGMVSQRKPRYVKRAQALAEVGIAALCFDFRGCGESDGDSGEIMLSQWLDDALLAFDYLSKQDFVDPTRVGVSGKSFGGYMGALVSGQRSVKSMVFQAPAVFPDEWFDKPYKFSDRIKRERLLYRMSQAALNNKAVYSIRKYKNPLLIVGSELDDTCPRNVVEGYYNECPSKREKIVWIKGADHPLRNEKYNEEYTKMMVEWFGKTL